MTPELRALARSVDSLYRADRLDSLLLTGSASPDGPAQLNATLSRERAATVARYLSFSTTVPPSTFIVKSKPATWSDLSRMISSYPYSTNDYSSSAATIIESEPGNPSAKLKMADNGNLWRWLAADVFPEMRNTEVTVYFQGVPSTPGTMPEEPRQSAAESQEEPAPVVTAGDETDDSFIHHVYVKTNLPAWLCMWINAAVEFDLAPHWSATLPVYYSGFNYFTRTLKFRTFAIQPEVRWWPSRQNHGFFLGAHFGMAYYNVALDGETRYQDHDGNTPALGGGLAVGYRFRLNSDPNLTMEATVGGGIYNLHYDTFRNYHNGPLTGSRRRTFFGVDQAALSLTYRFGMTRKKGGDK